MLNPFTTTHTERAIVGTLVFAALQRGYRLSVHDGQDWTVENANDEARITSALATTGYDTLKITKAGKMIGSVFLVWGNDEDIIADHTDNTITGDLVAIAIKDGEDTARINRGEVA